MPKLSGDVAADRAALAQRFATWAARNKDFLTIALAQRGRVPRSLAREFTHFIESWEKVHGEK